MSIRPGKRKRYDATLTQVQAEAPLSALAARKLALQQSLLTSSEETTPVKDVLPDNAPRSEHHDWKELEIHSNALSSDATSSDEHDSSDSRTRSKLSSIKPYIEKQSRYFSASTRAEPPSDGELDKSAADEDMEPEASTSQTRPAVPTQIKRRLGKRRRPDGLKAGPVDPTCASTWQPIYQKNSYLLNSDASNAGRSLIIGLKGNERLVVKGVFSMHILRGSIFIDGAILETNSGACDVFAPTTHPLPVVQAISEVEAVSPDNINMMQLPYGIQFKDQMPEFPVVLLLRDNQSGIEGIEKICKLAGMPIPTNGMWQSTVSGRQSINGKSFEIITEPEGGLTSTVLLDDWRKALSAVLPQSHEEDRFIPAYGIESAIHIVQGPKAVGKSTFAKMLCNTLLSRHRRVAYLNCDIGQAELTPPGLLSLHILNAPLIGPAFVHCSHHPVRAHFFGATTPRNNPALYLTCIADLLSYYTNDCNESNEPLPLVINTQGWVKGLGADLLAEIHQLAKQTIIFNFQAISTFDEDLHDTFPSTFLQESNAQIIHVQPFLLTEHGPARLTAADLRTISLISYFHLSDPSSEVGLKPLWDFSSSIVNKRPYVVPWNTFNEIQLLGSEHVPFEEVLRALDASIVAIIDSENGESQIINVDPAGFAYNPNQDASIPMGTCLGLGIIRSIDRMSRTFHILTSTPPDILSRARSLSKGDIELPTILMTEYANEKVDTEGVCGVEWKRVPYLESRDAIQQGIGTTRRRVRRNVMRKAQFH